jgi:hypothetical protein
LAYLQQLQGLFGSGADPKQIVKEMACGFRSLEHYKTVIHFHCGELDLCPKLETALP